MATSKAKPADTADPAAVADDTTAAAATDTGAVAVVDEVSAKLKEFGVPDEVAAKIKDELGATTVDDLASLTADDLVAAGMKMLPARKMAAALTAATTPSVAMADPAASFARVLPPVPNFESLLGMLKIGGVLKIEQSTVVGLVQAAIAKRADLFSLPTKLAAAMLTYAKKNDEPVDNSYYTIKNQLTQRRYGDLFSAIPGFDGRSVTDGAKNELFNLVNTYLWPAVTEFATLLDNWEEAWMRTANNPAAFQQAILALRNGATGAMPAASIGAAPPTGGLRDAADKVNDAANKVFAGEGIQISAAVAFETGEIRKVLSDPRLPGMIGTANRELMLKELGIDVGAADERFETDVTQYVAAVLQVKDQASGQGELDYFNALYMLGSQIPWERLGARRISGIGGRDIL